MLSPAWLLLVPPAGLALRAWWPRRPAHAPVDTVIDDDPHACWDDGETTCGCPRPFDWADDDGPDAA